MMNLEQLTKIQTMEYIIQIVKEYKEALTEQPGMSDYRKEQLKLVKFDEILKEVEWCEMHLEGKL